MMERLGRFFCRLVERLLPDAQVLAVLLTLGVVGLALAAPQSEALRAAGGGERFTSVSKMWYAGFANPDFLTFALQMCLILLTGYGLAKAPAATRLLDRIAGAADTNRGGVVLVALVSAVGGWINWGLGLIAAGLLAGRIRARLAARGIVCQYPLIVAAAYVTMMTWHGGLSGSAPLKVSHGVPVTQTVEGRQVTADAGPITIKNTVFAPANLALTLALFIGVPLVLRAMAGDDETLTNAECMTGGGETEASRRLYAGARNDAVEPSNPRERGGKPFGALPDTTQHESRATTEPPSSQDGGGKPRRSLHDTAHHALLAATEPSNPPDRGGEPRGSLSLAARLDRTSWIRLPICLFAAGVLAVQALDKGWGAVNLNFVNLAFLAAGLLLHPSIVSYVSAVAEGGKAVTGIILQFPLYGGIEGVISGAGIAAAISQGFIDAAHWTSAATGLAPATTFPLATFASATVVNVFIPSGGGQWMVQGPIMCSAAQALHVPLPQTVMAVAYGDELTNMIQPFWAVPLMGLTAVDPRRFMGYCALLMILAAPAFVLTLVLF